jgi:peptide/nickel transport system substrate-binding protein
VASIRSEPRSFNSYAARDATTELVSLLTQTSLVKVNRVTDRVEPELAESWERLDARSYRLRLRKDLRFSDGQPFSSDDVTFSFRALYDERAGTVLGDVVTVGHQPLQVHAEDAHTVVVTFPAPFAPGLRLLDAVPILPRHRLEAALDEGRFAAAWGPSTPPSELAGLGPFVIDSVSPGEWITLRRNPHHLAAAPEAEGQAPERIVLRIVSDQDAEQLLLASGELDLTASELRPSDYGTMARQADERGLLVHEVGVGLDGDLLWLNLATAPGRANARWRQHRAFRQAIAKTIDRRAFADTVYLGAAVPSCGLVSPGNRAWYVAPPPCERDLAEARRLLATLDLADADGDGMLDQPGVGPACLTLLTQAGNTSLERGAVFVRDSLRTVGIRVDVVPLSVGALIERITKGDYEAAYFRLLTTDSDPAMNLDYWLSSGSAHVWYPSQASPATEWERRVDALMGEVAASPVEARRREAFGEVQAILAGEQPAFVFAYPRVWVATSRRVAGGAIAVRRPYLLWRPLAIALGDASDGGALVDGRQSRLP